jgi:electron transport complex protein RnfE
VDSLWRYNSGLVWLLGLCPSLAVTTSAIYGLALGLVILFVMVASSACVSLTRNWLHSETRLLMFVLIIASLIGAIELTMNAYFHDLYIALGIYLPLIAINWAVIGHADNFASERNVAASTLHGLGVGAGLALVLVILGGLRELLGQGTLLAGAELMFGATSRSLSITFIEDYQGFLLAVLPPGAFIALGLLIALKNAIDRRMRPRAEVTKSGGLKY